jgi:hypothetical protein
MQSITHLHAVAGTHVGCTAGSTRRHARAPAMGSATSAESRKHGPCGETKDGHTTMIERDSLDGQVKSSADNKRSHGGRLKVLHVARPTLQR